MIRKYQAQDVSAIAQLFYNTIHSVNLADYSPAQVQAWAPKIPDLEVWHQRMISRYTVVAEQDGEILGFAELEDNGHLDMFYCRHDVVRQGVGTQLYHAIAQRASELGLERIFTEASITARPFFERQGFQVMRQETVTRQGVELDRFVMEKKV